MNDNSRKEEMSADELGDELRRMHDNAPEGMQMTSIHLFGIKYARQIERLGGNACPNIYQRAGRKRGHTADLRHGIRLAEFVEIKGKFPPW